MTARETPAKKAASKEATAKKTSAKKAPAGKTSAKKAREPRPTMKEVQASWEDGYRPFVEECRGSFGFLVHDLGFAPAEIYVLAPECAVSFVKGHTLVRIHFEYFGPPWVVVRIGDPPKGYGLFELVRELMPEHEGRQPAMPSLPTTDQARTLLDHHATFLRAHADRILAPDAELVARLDTRRAQAQAGT
jgi:hypothetical protein